MLLINIVIILQIVSACWCRYVPPAGTDGTDRATLSPRQLWERLKTVDSEDTPAVEYSRVEPVSTEFGTSPSSLYLMEAYRQIEDSEAAPSVLTAFSASMFEGQFIVPYVTIGVLIMSSPV